VVDLRTTLYRFDIPTNEEGQVVTLFARTIVESQLEAILHRNDTAGTKTEEESDCSFPRGFPFLQFSLQQLSFLINFYDALIFPKDTRQDSLSLL